MTLIAQLQGYVSAMPQHQRERKAGQLLIQSLAHMVEADRRLAEASTLNHDLSRQVARLLEEMNPNKL